jgi:hypothetical protein
VLEIISKGGVKGLAHITGGGFTDNIPRVFPSGCGAKIFTGSWEIPPIFSWLQQARTNDLQTSPLIFSIAFDFQYMDCLVTLYLYLDTFNIYHYVFCRLETLMMQRCGEHSIWALEWFLW